MPGGESPRAPDGIRLTLLDGAAWCGRPLPGSRPHALLAALAVEPERPPSDERLADEVWGAEAPAHPVKALQVLVSRIRSQTSAAVVVRGASGYRLGLAPAEVDALALRSGVELARRVELAGDLAGAAAAAGAALSIPCRDPGPPGTDSEPVSTLLGRAAADRREAGSILGRAASGRGDHATALASLVPVAEAGGELDDPTMAALLRSEAAVRGAASALVRYEHHRARLRDRLGVDPGPLLQAVHAELLAADRPVRTGLLHAATSLVGRDDDAAALRGALRTSRVTSIVGPGGLGKTRLAQLVAREAEQAVVHVVELVGVSTPEDVVGELGSALGVRDSVAGRRVLTPEQRVDVRARIAEYLDRAPTLLVLDNCEHLVEAVAELVAFLVAAAPRLTVLTTSRAPLAIAAERVFALRRLTDDEAAELFSQRARAARPGVRLDPDAVGRVVARLDGLPLAVELAAAKVRVMGVDDVARRLDDRFALLAGHDRGAPDRHQTLLSVIDWSWRLLEPDEQRALAWLSVFHDGFSLDAAESVLGRAAALRRLSTLVDHSLLAVVEAGVGTRYRMLETVREFGLRQLAETGEQDDALTAQRRWAVDLAGSAWRELHSARQVETMDRLHQEEGNLADLLRGALSRGDAETTAVLFAALGAFWSITGEHPRVVALGAAADETLGGWTPPPALTDTTAMAVTLLLWNASMVDALPLPGCADLARRLRPGVRMPAVAALMSVVTAYDPTDTAGSAAQLAALCDDPDRLVAGHALQWHCHALENAGDAEGAIEAARRALDLWREEDGPWSRALLHTLLSSLYAQLGRHELAGRHASLAAPVLDRLDASDDAMQVRAVLAVGAMTAGDLARAERLVEEIEAIERRRSGLGGPVVIASARAELALAAGDVEEGLRRYHDAVGVVRELRFPGLGEPTGLEPWTLFSESSALVAHARHGGSGDDLALALSGKAAAVLDPGRAHLDFPVAGLVLYALGVWRLTTADDDPDPGVRMLALAHRFGYNRFVPTMAWEHGAALAERRAPGALARMLRDDADRAPAELLDEARTIAGAPPAQILRP